MFFPVQLKALVAALPYTSLLPSHFMSSMCTAVGVRVNGVHIVALSPANCLYSALHSNLTLV